MLAKFRLEEKPQNANDGVQLTREQFSQLWQSTCCMKVGARHPCTDCCLLRWVHCLMGWVAASCTLVGWVAKNKNNKVMQLCDFHPTAEATHPSSVLPTHVC